MSPTSASIARAFPKLTRQDANKVRLILDRVNYPQEVQAALEGVSDIIGGFGAEYIQKGHNLKSPAMTYVNMGDTYRVTIIYVNGHFRIGCWGNTVEAGHYD